MADSLKGACVALGVNGSGVLTFITMDFNQQAVNAAAANAVKTGGYQTAAAYFYLEPNITYRGGPGVGTTEEAAPIPAEEPAPVP